MVTILTTSQTIDYCCNKTSISYHLMDVYWFSLKFTSNESEPKIKCTDDINSLLCGPQIYL